MRRGSGEDYALAAIGAVSGGLKYYVRPEITSKRTWLAIGAVVAIHELACPPGQLLSESYDRGLDKHRLALTAATLIMTGHLLNAFGDHDPVSRVLDFLKT